MKEIKGTTALITGASRGIGVHIAKALAQRGVNVALAARSEAGLEASRNAVSALGVKAVAIPTDVSVASQRTALIERVESEIGPVDILVNNAGIESSRAYTDFSEQAVEQMIAINFTAALLLTRAVLPGMLARRRGQGQPNVAVRHIWSRDRKATVATSRADSGLRDPCRWRQHGRCMPSRPPRWRRTSERR